MPGSFGYSNNNFRAMDIAKRQVRTKFPNLQEGSSGWYRAVENRFKRIK